MAFERVYDQTDFTSGMNDAAAFGAEIAADLDVGPIYSHVEESGTTITVRFISDSNPTQDAALDAVVAAHGGGNPPAGSGANEGGLGIVTEPLNSGLVFGDQALASIRIGGEAGGAPLLDDASVELADNDAALLLNRLTTTERDALTDVAGMLIYNTTTNRLEEYDGSRWRPAGGPSPAVLMFGADNIATSTTTRFLFPSYVEFTAGTTRREFAVPRDGVIRSMHVQVRTIGLSAGDTITYTLEVDGSPSALAVTMSVTDLTGANTTNEVAVTQGQRVGLRVTKSGEITMSPSTILVTMDFGVA